MSEPEVNVDHFVLLHVVTEAPQWLKQRERLGVLARAQRDPALSQTGQRAQPVIGLGIGKFDGDSCMRPCLFETALNGVPHGKERRRATLRPAIAQLHCERRGLGQTCSLIGILKIELAHAAA